MSAISWSPAPCRSSVRRLAPPALSPRLAPRSLALIPDPAPRSVRPLVARLLAAGGGGAEHRVDLADEISTDVVVRTLLIDNYDSYTYNIYQELCVVNGVPPVVVHNDEWTWEFIYHCLYKEKAFDNIVISPGPGTPTCPTDVGICHRILLECKDIPILGVCLGHQALGFVHGAEIIHAPEPIHGRLSEIEHTGCELFKDIPSGTKSGFKVVRYHSLIIDADSLPEELIPIAWTTFEHKLSLLETQKFDKLPNAFGDQVNQCRTSGDPSFDTIINGFSGRKILMGVRHSTRPHYGVQFHPESVATYHGRQIFKNFKEMTVNHGLRRKLLHERKVSHACQLLEDLPKGDLLQNGPAIRQFADIYGTSMALLEVVKVKYLRLQWKRFDSLLSEVGGSENIFCKLFGDHNLNNTFWLDSSSTDKSRARFSFMGGQGGSLWKQLTFHLSDRARQVGYGKSKMTAKVGGYLTIEDNQGSLKTILVQDGLFDFLDKELQSLSYDKRDYEGLPFDFYGGFIGYLGYDLKVECGASSNNHKSRTPDACFFFADNLVVIDHWNGHVYILSLHENHTLDGCMGPFNKFKQNSWLVETEKRLLSLKSSSPNKLNKQKLRRPTPSLLSEEGRFVVEKSRSQYVKDINRCLELIKDGESYELCLTTQMRKKVDNINALNVYLNLRNQNPAPYAAWLNFTNQDLCICSSSPERFLRLDRTGVLEAKPIKGTIARGRTPSEDEHLRLQLQYSEKDQAENLMIVDLLRNDIGRVCEPGSVHVPRLMEVESYATVHTLVSTIQGKRKSDASPIACVRAAFPGGSMTGAPKLRSMEILDSLESCSRGIYSGSIGFFSYNQTFDLNIVIRTVVIHKGEASVGAGGAIIALSNPEDEYAEMMLKAKVPTRVVEECSKHSNTSDPMKKVSS